MSNSLTLTEETYALTVVEGDDLQLTLSGERGPSGPNTVSTSTTTALNGYIYGNGTTVAGATAAATASNPNTLVLRDALGASEFGGISTNGQVEFNGVDAGDSLTFNMVNYSYGAGAAAAHRTALGLGTGDSPTFANVFLPSTGIFGANASNGLLCDGFDFYYRRAGANQMRFGFDHIKLTSGGTYQFGSGSSIVSNASDLFLARDAAGTLAQRNGLNAQESRIYGTYTDTSNYRRLALKMSNAGVATVASEGLGSGVSSNSLQFQTDGTTRLTIAAHAFTNSGLVVTSTGNNSTTVGFGSGTGANITRGVSGGFVFSDSAGTGPMIVSTRDIQINGGNLRVLFSTANDGAASLATSTGGGSPTRHNIHNIGALAHTTLRVQGGTSVGRSYFDTAPPTDGMLVQGNVGIGTTSPTAKLHSVNGDLNTPAGLFENTRNGGGDYGVRIRNSNTGGSAAVLRIEGLGTGNLIEAIDNATPVFVVMDGGNVGIGTTSPASKLTVTGGDAEVTDSANGVILKAPNGTRYRITVDNAGALTTTAI